jgi:tetraacyldisaccharide 4'-kinase
VNTDRLVESWYHESAAARFLAPLAFAYRGLSGMRRVLYRRGILPTINLDVPVIVVGNISVGGTGKTPLTMWLVHALSGRGAHPAVVCKSYRGSARAAGRVAPDDDPAHYGDEAVLLASRLDCPVYSGPHRGRAAHLLRAENPWVDLIVCDDGLQHYGLARDVEIAIIDAARGFGNGHMLPAGPLREPLSRLHSVDAIVINGSGAPAPSFADRPVFKMQLSGEVFRNVCDSANYSPALGFLGQRIAAIAGIGNPTRFFDTLRGLKLDFTAFPFPDHHRYEPRELAFAGYDIVLMTEKDAIKCRRFADPRMWVLPVNAVVDDDLATLVLSRIGQRSR